MNLNILPQLKIGNFTAKVPIIQGGMSVGVSLSGLASAVANEGGIGVIGAAAIGMNQPDFSRDYREANQKSLIGEIKKTREKTDGIIGVNIMVALTDFNELLLTSFREKVDLVFLGAGLPLLNSKIFLPEVIKNSATKVVPIVSSARAANLIFKYWAKNYNHVPDAVVVEGPLAGGHLGFKKDQINNTAFNLEKILPEVISTINSYEEQFDKKIPVIAAGGIYSGKDIYKFIKLGASGVQMATRFVTTEECDASYEFKNTYLKCKKDDIVLIDSPVGMPGRAIINKFLEDVAQKLKKPFKCPWKCLKTCDVVNAPYCIAQALINAKKGKLKNGFAFAGANAYLTEKIVSVKQLMSTLINEYRVATI